jgi:hypothetical protein
MKKQLLVILLIAVTFISCENPMVIDILPDRTKSGGNNNKYIITFNVEEEIESTEEEVIAEETEEAAEAEEAEEAEEAGIEEGAEEAETAEISEIAEIAEIEEVTETTEITEETENTVVLMFSVNFNANDGTNRMETQEIPENTTEALRRNTFKKAGYMVTGWSTTREGNVEYTDGADYTAGEGLQAENLYAVWAFDPNAFRPGDIGPGGGKIYYISEEGFTVQMADPAKNYKAHYFEAAAINQPVPAQWGAHGKLLKNITTFAYGTDAEAGVIGNGRKDTQLILDYLGTSASNSVAQLCYNYKKNGLGDWFLPSIGELNLLYISGISGITGKVECWSSSQATVNSAWIMDLEYGISGYGTKNDTRYKVVAVRAF